MKEKRKHPIQPISGFITLMIGVVFLGGILAFLVNTLLSGLGDSNTAPVISNIMMREEWTDSGLIIFQDIAFTDGDGDAARADFTLVETSYDRVDVKDGIVTEHPTDQRAGAIHTAKWTCSRRNYTVTLQVELIDQNHNRSEPYTFTLTCRDG
jgi:hypothetical protein